MTEFLNDVERQMKRALDHCHHELSNMWIGRASLALLDGVTVDIYGAQMAIHQLATLYVPDASTVVAKPFDPKQIADIERAIRNSGRNLQPSIDGNAIRVPVAPPTQDQVREFVKKAHDIAERARTAIRHARRDGNDQVKQKALDGEISQDDGVRGEGELQKLHDHYIGEVDKALAQREREILEK